MKAGVRQLAEHDEADAMTARRLFRHPGGADRDRTGDPLVANQVLSQLSYRPVIMFG